MNRLSKLANKWKTDKGTSYGDAHGYTEFYQQFFEKYEHPKIIEIGVLDGASIHMLNEFFDGDCEIWCCDWNADYANNVKDLKNVHFHWIDAGNKESIENFRKSVENIRFNIIIDDASHQSQHQFNLLSGLHTLLSDDGIYIIEDIHFSRWNEGGYNNDLTNPPLFFINFMWPSNQLTEEENTELLDKIDNVFIFGRKNTSNIDMITKYRGRSMTAILTFDK